MKTLATTLTLISALAAGGCASTQTRRTTCQAYDYGRAAACAACAALPDACPWAVSGSAAQ